MSGDDIDTVMSKLLQAERELKEAKAEIKRLNVELSKGQARIEVVVAALAAGATPDSLPDIENRANTAGWAMEDGRAKLPNSNIGPNEWVQGLKTSAKHFFTQPADNPQSPARPGAQNGGGGGQPISKGRDNPWTRDGWNETDQARVYNEQGRDRAKAMAEAVGSSLGALKPK